MSPNATNFTSIHHLVSGKDKKTPAQRIGSYSKEGEPVAQKDVQTTQTEVLFDEVEPKIENQEIEQYVQTVVDHGPEIHPDLKKAGLSTIAHVSLDPKQKIHLPISDEKIIEGLQQPVNSSWRWLALFLMHLLKKAHIALKTIHGHVVRVLVP